MPRTMILKKKKDKTELRCTLAQVQQPFMVTKNKLNGFCVQSRVIIVVMKEQTDFHVSTILDVIGDHKNQ